MSSPVDFIWSNLACKDLISALNPSGFSFLSFSISNLIFLTLPPFA